MATKAKWLQDERYIRIAGALLLLSPFLNYFTTVFFTYDGPNRWAISTLIAGFFFASTFTWIGRIATLTVGYLMFRGKSSAWVPVLAILAFIIAKNIITFKSDILTNRIQTISGLITNIGLFLLVFASEYRITKELNQRLKNLKAQKGPAQATLKPAETDKPTVATVTPSEFAKKIKPKELFIRKGLPIEFAGHGKIAEVFHCTHNELWLKVTNHLPSDIHKKTVLLDVPGSDKPLRLKFSSFKDESTLIFKVVTKRATEKEPAL